MQLLLKLNTRNLTGNRPAHQDVSGLVHQRAASHNLNLFFHIARTTDHSTESLNVLSFFVFAYRKHFCFQSNCCAANISGVHRLPPAGFYVVGQENTGHSSFFDTFLPS